MSTTVLGAGYAGIMAANRLAGQGEDVVLITPHPWFVERIRLHTVASGIRPQARIDLSTLLNPAVRVLIDTATRIDGDAVLLASGRVQRYETLIYAVGSGAPSPTGAHRIASESEAERLREDLRLHPGAPVTVVGAGFTGIELAAALRRAGRTVRLVTASAPRLPAAEALLDELRRLGVQLEIGRTVETGNGSTARVDAGESITVDTTGLIVPRLATDSGLASDEHGRLLVNEHLTVPDHPHILGAGDAVHVAGPHSQHLRAACATALPMGAYAADVVLARRDARPIEPFGMGYVLQCVDLGSGRGRVQFVNPDDSARQLAIGGRAGGLIKETICRMTVRWLTQERVRAGRYSWPSLPAATMALAIAEE